MKIEEQRECRKPHARKQMKKGRRLRPRLVQEVVEDKTFHRLSLKTKGMTKNKLNLMRDFKLRQVPVGEGGGRTPVTTAVQEAIEGKTSQPLSSKSRATIKKTKTKTKPFMYEKIEEISRGGGGERRVTMAVQDTR